MAKTFHNDYSLTNDDEKLVLKKESTNEKIFVDFLSGEFRQRLKTIGKSQPLFKALAIESNDRLIDATAGLGRDALCFCYFGAMVTAVEENPIVFQLLEDGVRRASTDSFFQERLISRLKLIHGNSVEFMKSSECELVYLDPMYPVIEKSAKPKKEMAFLREILEPTNNIEEMLEAALNCAKKRVVIKRPVGSPVLGRVNHSFESKMVRFDMYLMNRRIM